MPAATFPPTDPFRERFPWIGGDLQTVRNYLVPPGDALAPWPAQRLSFPAGDGSGDRLLGALHRPADAAGRPLVVLVHGLTGCEGSFYVLETARFLLAAGYPVLRLNLRGAGPSRATCVGHYSAASTGDIAAALDSLDAAVGDGHADGHADGAPWRRGLVLVGYSLGGSIVLKLLAERPGGDRFLCAATVSAPIDLGATARRMMARRNTLYHRWLLGRMKDEAVAGAAAVSDAERAAIAGARSVYGFDDAFVAPRNGFAGAEDYYARCSAVAHLDRIATPTLVIHGLNDPWIPRNAYDAVLWSEFPALTPVLVDGGGHVGFHGAGAATPWHNIHLTAFIRRHEAP